MTNLIGSALRRVRRFFYKRILLPVLNREMKRQGIHFYQYLPEGDRLAVWPSLPWRLFDRRDKSHMGEGHWYHTLASRGVAADVVFDVGAGYGATSIWFANWAKQVFLFEPHPRNRRFVEEHHRIRRVDNVELVPAAVSNRSGTATLFSKAYDGHHALSDVGASETTETFEVETVTLDEFAAARGIEHIDVLKVDVEGFEAEVFEGAAGLLGRHAVDLVLFEYSPPFYVARGVDPALPLRRLTDHGYRITDLQGEPIDAVSAAGGRQQDLLAEPERRS